MPESLLYTPEHARAYWQGAGRTPLDVLIDDLPAICAIVGGQSLDLVEPAAERAVS